MCFPIVTYALFGNLSNIELTHTHDNEKIPSLV